MPNPSLAEFLRSIDIPDCGCPFERLPCNCREARDGKSCRCPPKWTPPCKHVLAANHGLSLAEWFVELHTESPGYPVGGKGKDGYGSPFYADRPFTILERHERVKLLAERHKRGLALWNPRDKIRMEDVSVTGEHYANGRDFETGLHALGEAPNINSREAA